MAFIGFRLLGRVRHLPASDVRGAGLAPGDLLALAGAAGLVLGLHPALRRDGRRPSRDRAGTRLRRRRIGIGFLPAWDHCRPRSFRRDGRGGRRRHGRLFISGGDRRSREDRRRASPQLHPWSRHGGGIGRHVRRGPGGNRPDRCRRVAECNSGSGGELPRDPASAVLHRAGLAPVRRQPAATVASRGPSGTACSERGFVLLFFGFFVCGFHVAFIQTHLPAYVGDRGLASAVGGVVARTDRPLQHFRLIRRRVVGPAVLEEAGRWRRSTRPAPS